ncbi:MAG TPA: adenine phosphoribosyltransferase [Longimicrobiales bacterium]|nr:adenine phosphoribosyltransferase [Longimicrobiales bacterium]
MSDLAGRIASTLRDVPDFPTPGILFRDITPVLADGPLLREITAQLAAHHQGRGIDVVAGIESRGFILGGAVAAALGTGFVPIRKPGKLPHHRMRVDYTLEYGSDALEAHIDAFQDGARVLIVDDVLATGGTAAAAVELVRRLGAHVTGAAFLLELEFLSGRTRIRDIPVSSILAFP